MRTLGIGDVTPSENLLDVKGKLLSGGYKSCTRMNKEMKFEKLKEKPDNALLETLEAKILKELSNVRDQAGKACKDHLKYQLLNKNFTY